MALSFPALLVAVTILFSCDSSQTAQPVAPGQPEFRRALRQGLESPGLPSFLQNVLYPTRREDPAADPAQNAESQSPPVIHSIFELLVSPLNVNSSDSTKNEQRDSNAPGDDKISAVSTDLGSELESRRYGQPWQQLSSTEAQLIEGLTDYLFFNRALTNEEQRVVWDNWNANDKALYNTYDGYWRSQDEERQQALLRRIPFIGQSQSEFLEGLRGFLDTQETDRVRIIQSLENDLRYSYFKYETYWDLLSVDERAHLTKLAVASEQPADTRTTAGLVPSTAEEFKEHLKQYLSFWVLSQREQMELWAAYTKQEQILFFEIQGYWTSLSQSQQQRLIGDLLHGRKTDKAHSERPQKPTAQQDFLLGLSRYLIFRARPESERSQRWQSFSDSIKERFANYRIFWESLSASEQDEHLSLIRTAAAGQSSVAANSWFPQDDFISMDLLLQLHRYLMFQNIPTDKQQQRWTGMTRSGRQAHARIDDFWNGLSLQRQGDAISRIASLLQGFPLAHYDSLSWGQVRFLTGLQHFLEHISLPMDEQQDIAKTWDEADWETHGGFEEYWWGLSTSEQLLVIDQLNQAQAAGEAGEAMAYKGEVTPTQRQLLKALSVFLEFKALDLRDKLILLSTSTVSDRKALEAFEPCWESISEAEKTRLVNVLSEPYILSRVKADLSELDGLC